MKELSSKTGPVERPRLSLEQKLLLIVHRYRAAEKRRKQKEAARSKRLRMIALFIVTAILLPSLAILFGRASASEAQVAFNHADRALASGHYWWTRLDRAVVLTPNAPAHVAPASDATVTFDLRGGQIVQEQKTYGDFALVRTREGHAGWLAQNDLARIVPLNGRVITAARLQRKPSTMGLAQGVEHHPTRRNES